MRPPKGFDIDKNPLLHTVKHNFGLSLADETLNTACVPLVRAAKATIATNPLTLPETIQVNPHNSGFEIDSGPLCAQMSIIDRMRISLKFSMTDVCQPAHLASGTAGPNFDDGVYEGDDIPAFNFLWRPIFNVYPEKLDAVDDFTTTTVKGILGLTKDDTLEDVVPITTNKLLSVGPSELPLPSSTVNGVEAFTDYNMTTNLNMEDHVFNEDTLQTGLRHYTNKGALRSCLGRTRHVTLTRQRPFKNFYIDKFVPRAIRRIQPYGFFAIQVHLPLDSHHSQYFYTGAAQALIAHLGVSIKTNYHEWNSEHDQDRGVPT